MTGKEKYFADRGKEFKPFSISADKYIVKFRYILLISFLSLLVLNGHPGWAEGAQGNGQGKSIPILLYHRFGPVAADPMTVTTPVFESHLRYLKENHYRVISLDELMAFYEKGQIPGPRAVVLTADDGHRTVFTEGRPLLQKYQMPMTLFLYPSAISNAHYAMTWEELQELKRTGLFAFQAHTFWHPNFKKDRERMTPAEFERSVKMQFEKSKAILEKRLGCRVDMMAWPFGIYDPWLMAKAAEAGYRAAFSMDARPVRSTDSPMALPRYLLHDGIRVKALASLLAQSNGQGK